MDGIAPIVSNSQVYAIAHELGLVPAIALVLCYLHLVVWLRPTIVRARAYLDAQPLTPDQLAAAEKEIPSVSAGGVLGTIKGVMGKATPLIALLALGTAIACSSVPATVNPRLHESLVKIQKGLELELRSTAPVSTAHAAQREALRADVAAAVSASAGP